MTDQERLSRADIGATVPPKGFDPFTAGKRDLLRYGVPQRPDPQTQPGLAALWDRLAQRYRGFDHLPAHVPRPTPQDGSAQHGATPEGSAQDGSAEDAAAQPQAAGLYPLEQCGFTLTSIGEPFTALFVTWTVPNLRFTPSNQGPNRFRTFLGLGFLDVHVEMTVDAAHAVTATVTALGVDTVGLPVEPGDVLSASVCLALEQPARANYVLANETRSETVSFAFDSHFPPAATINAGVSRSAPNGPFNPLAQFGIVYFDEISAYSTGGFRSLTSGNAVGMVDRDGSTLATAFRMSDFAFKVVRA